MEANEVDSPHAICIVMVALAGDGDTAVVGREQLPSVLAEPSAVDDESHVQRHTPGTGFGQDF